MGKPDLERRQLVEEAYRQLRDEPQGLVDRQALEQVMARRRKAWARQDRAAAKALAKPARS